MPGLYIHKAVGSFVVRQLVCVHCTCCVTCLVVQDARCLVHAVDDSGASTLLLLSKLCNVSAQLFLYVQPYSQSLVSNLPFFV